MKLHALFYSNAGELRSGWWLALWFLFWSIARFVLVTTLGPWLQDEIAVRLVESVALVLAALACLRLQRRAWREVGLGADRRWWREAGLGLLLGLGLMTGTALLLRAFGGFHWEGVPRPSAPLILWGLALFAAVALHEELLFRGYAFQRLVDALGPWPAQLLAAAYFAYVHWNNPGLEAPVLKRWATVNIALAAILLGLAYLRTRSLALPIGLHFGWNWAQGCLLGFPVSGTTDAPGFLRTVLHGKPQWLSGGAFGLEGSALCAFVVGGWILWWLRPVSAGPSIDGAPSPAPK